jgi:LynF/TruF/PatF family peptide O-prenyltransferase
MTSCSENLRYIEEHQDYFNATNPFPLDIFKNIVSRTPNLVVECSCKVSKHKVHANRFNLWFPNPNEPAQMQTVMNFFAEVEKKGKVQFNWDLLNQFYNSGFDWTRLRQFVFGVDIRDNQADSRLKIWFILKDYPEKKEKAIELHGGIPEIRTLLLHDEFLVGFDFYFNGRNVIKLYPDIRREELIWELLRNQAASFLHPSAIELACHAYWLHVYFSDNHRGRVLQLHTTNSDPFFNYLREEDAQPFRKLYREKKLPCAIFAFNEDDIKLNDIQNWSFYYLPQSTQQNTLFI